MSFLRASVLGAAWAGATVRAFPSRGWTSAQSFLEVGSLDACALAASSLGASARSTWRAVTFRFGPWPSAVFGPAPAAFGSLPLAEAGARGRFESCSAGELARSAGRIVSPRPASALLGIAAGRSAERAVWLVGSGASPPQPARTSPATTAAASDLACITGTATCWTVSGSARCSERDAVERHLRAVAEHRTVAVRNRGACADDGDEPRPLRVARAICAACYAESREGEDPVVGRPVPGWQLERDRVRRRTCVHALQVHPTLVVLVEARALDLDTRHPEGMRRAAVQEWRLTGCADLVEALRRREAVRGGRGRRGGRGGRGVRGVGGRNLSERALVDVGPGQAVVADLPSVHGAVADLRPGDGVPGDVARLHGVLLQVAGVDGVLAGERDGGARQGGQQRDERHCHGRRRPAREPLHASLQREMGTR